MIAKGQPIADMIGVPIRIMMYLLLCVTSQGWLRDPHKGSGSRGGGRKSPRQDRLSRLKGSMSETSVFELQDILMGLCEG